MLTKIKNLCRERGLTLRQLEEKANLGKCSVYNWSKHCPSADRLQRVADVLEVKVDELLKDEIE